MNRTDATIVTGGGRGIGRTIASRMAQEGPVLVVGRTLENLVSICEEINENGGEADWLVGDVADPTTARRAVAAVRQHGWTVRNLVANAAAAKGGALTEMDPKHWYEMFSVNVHGTYEFIAACAPEMIERRAGSICIVSSVSGLKGSRYESGYCATKFALVGLAQSLAHEYAKYNIAVVPLCPGYVESEMTERVIVGKMKYRGLTRNEAVNLIASANPQKRLLTQDEIAAATAFVCSGAGLSLSGQAIEFHGATDARVLELVHWLHKHAAAAKELLIPVSGGSDSALCFALCSLAYPDKTVAVYLGSPETLRCRAWFERQGQVLYVTDVAPVEGNLEIARWTKVLAMSNARNAWLVGSRNHTEELTGFYSLVSRLATFMPLANVWKSEVMELCDLIKVPSEITASSRREDPDCGRPTEIAEIPLETIDTFLKVEEGQLPATALDSITEGQQKYLGRLIAANRFKRFLPTRGPSVNFAGPRQN